MTIHLDESTEGGRMAAMILRVAKRRVEIGNLPAKALDRAEKKYIGEAVLRALIAAPGTGKPPEERVS